MSRQPPEVPLSHRCFFMVLCCIFMASIFVGSIGAVFYVKEKHNESIYKPTMCFVQNYSLVESTCRRQQCSIFIQPCTTVYYICNLDTYAVIYNVSDGRQIQSITTATDGPGPKSINGTYQCYYDSTNETSVRWTWSNSNKYLIMLCVGWSIVGLLLLLSIVIIIWAEFKC